jgi:DNA repair exonuclease SbcCD ATPase subunit
MKIDKLQIRNFRSHQQTVLPLARLNVIRGLNGYGKSSIQMAIEEAFTGRCVVTDPRWRQGIRDRD